MAARSMEERSQSSSIPISQPSRMQGSQLTRGNLAHLSESPRPSSVGSTHSNQSSTNMSTRGTGPTGRSRHEICVGEELKIAVDIALERFRLNDEQNELEFPSSLTSTERAYIHRLCAALGLKSKSKGKGANRYLTLHKKDGSLCVQSAAAFNLVRNSRHQIAQLVQRFPVTNKERQDLLPRNDRGQYQESFSRELSKMTTGRLNNGVPQIPSQRGQSDLNTFRQTLPVNAMRDDIVKAINENKVILISGETGSGKTTQVPQMILDEHHAQNKPCRIFCTQPRRISALSVAERVASERGEKIGQTVGYQIRLESRVSPKTLLTFCTNGVLLRTLMGGDGALATLTHVIVDEIHERDRFSDFLLIVLRDSLHKYRNLRLILMSAALNVHLFSNYFNGCPIIHVPGKLFDVKEYFLEDILKLTGYTNKEMQKYRKDLSKVETKMKQLNLWYSAHPADKTSKESDNKAAEKDQTSEVDNRTVELGAEKEDLEPWVVKEMDQLLSEAWLTGKEDPFMQIFHLIMSENVSVDYIHTETSATPLMIAAGRGFFGVVEQLLNLGGNVHIRATNDWTALDWAKKFERNDIVEVLEAQMSASPASRDQGEMQLVQQSQSLSVEDRELLNIYHHSFDDDKVDTNLVMALIIKIYTTTTEGAILVFLPGYDDIVAIRDRILEDKRFGESNKYILYVLHSAMQSTDQKRVFKNPPNGVRKIILSTNIAETSITINDVVYVIDSGKVKEKSFDALSSVSMLKSNWVSKASALQRKGRAGRCRPGVCYHLFSRVRHDSMQQYPDPEILRYPLQELCLHTKLLAPTNCSIADFLSKAPEPPAFLITRNAVHLLKQIDALDTFEDLTELGHHLADLPVEPRYGKMVLYSVVLKCLDPVLTIACALAYRDPFQLPRMPSQKRAAAAAKKKFSAGTHSDHMALLRAFQAWQRARTEGWERSFCDKNFLSASTMEMIVGIRTQLLGQLRASGFVRARGGGDIRDLNTNSENWAVVKAALVAGMYPHVIRVNRAHSSSLTTMKEDRVRFHNSSVLAPSNMVGENTHSKAVKQVPTDWLIFEEMTRAHRLAHVKCCTVVSAMTLAVFAGPAKLSLDTVKEAESGMLGGQGDGSYPNEVSSDSEVEEKEEQKRTNFKLDDWLQFRVDPEAANLAMQLRQKWHSLFLRRMRAPSKPWSQVDESVIRTVIGVLTNEEQATGLQQPAGIGQRPKPMSTESLMVGGGSRRGSYDNEHSDDSSNNSDSRQLTPKGRPFKFSTNTTPKRKDFKEFGKSRSTEDKSETSSVRSSSSAPGSANNSGTSSLRGSATSSPCASPQPSSPSKWADRDPGANSTHPSRFFVMKATSHKILDISYHKSNWATNNNNEKKLNKAFKDGKIVYLIFSVHGSGHFQGFARMMSAITSDRTKEFSAPGLTGTFQVEWVKRGNLPFQHCHHLTNPWNENKKVQISRDGQEIEPSVGESLLKLWDKIPAYQPKVPANFNTRNKSGESHGEGSGEPAETGRTKHWSGDKGHGSYGGQSQWGGHGGHYGGYGPPGGYHGGMYGPMMGPYPGHGSISPGQNMSPVMILQRGQGQGHNRPPHSSPNYSQGHYYGHKGPK